MNLILFESSELEPPVLARDDPRAVHILDILRRRPGDLFDVGVVDGPRGKAILVEVLEIELVLSFSWGPRLPPLDSLRLIIGLPRPQTARKILQDATAMGVDSLDFVMTERNDAQYAQSTLWSSGEWRRHLVAGAAQAFDTRLPKVTWGRALEATVETLDHTRLLCVALDNYEGAKRLSQCDFLRDVEGTWPRRIVLALGPERGWGPQDRILLRERGFMLAHLGERVLRTETAAVAAIAIVRASMGTM